MRSLLSIDDLDAAVRRSHERPVVIFKHSVSCGTSAMALEEIESPQALILDRGAVEWHGSHFRVSQQHLAAAMKRLPRSFAV